MTDIRFTMTRAQALEAARKCYAEILEGDKRKPSYLALLIDRHLDEAGAKVKKTGERDYSVLDDTGKKISDEIKTAIQEAVARHTEPQAAGSFAETIQGTKTNGRGGRR
jgi:hypothetical protein